MELVEALKTRRSIRRYKEKPLSQEKIKELIETAIWCPSASKVQPWGFAVISDKEYMRELSDQAKAGLLNKYSQTPGYEKYKIMMENPNFNIFYNAPTLVLIYGKKNGIWSKYDCSMLAQNLMLVAWEQGIGSCWIGFAQDVCNTSEFKAKHQVSDDYELVAPIILGYPEIVPKNSVPRKEYPIFSWS